MLYSLFFRLLTPINTYLSDLLRLLISLSPVLTAFAPQQTRRIMTDRNNVGGNVITSVHPSVRPFVSTLSSEPTDRWP